jgi:hypothetical protein
MLASWFLNTTITLSVTFVDSGRACPTLRADCPADVVCAWAVVVSAASKTGTEMAAPRIKLEYRMCLYPRNGHTYDSILHYRYNYV